MTFVNLKETARDNLKHWREIQPLNNRIWFPALTIALAGQASTEQISQAYRYAIEKPKENEQAPGDILRILASFCPDDPLTYKWILGDEETFAVIHQSIDTSRVQNHRIRFFDVLRYTYDECMPNNLKPLDKSGQMISDFWVLWDSLVRTEQVMDLLSNGDVNQAHTVLTFFATSRTFI